MLRVWARLWSPPSNPQSTHRLCLCIRTKSPFKARRLTAPPADGHTDLHHTYPPSYHTGWAVWMANTGCWGHTSREIPPVRAAPPTQLGASLTDVVGAGEEVEHEGGLGQVGQDVVMHEHQHLLVEADGQLRGHWQVRVQPTNLTPLRPGTWRLTLCLRKPSHMTWNAFLCSCSGAGRHAVLLIWDPRPRPRPPPTQQGNSSSGLSHRDVPTRPMGTL